MEYKTVKLLQTVSEQLAEWSLNDGPLDAGKITSHEQTQLDHLESQVEEAIIEVDPTWLSA